MFKKFHLKCRIAKRERVAAHGLFLVLERQQVMGTEQFLLIIVGQSLPTVIIVQYSIITYLL